MRRRWSTPLLWMVFTALATVVGLGSVSLVRHDVVATSLQPTSATDVSKVLGSTAPATATGGASPTEPAATPSVAPSGTQQPTPSSAGTQTAAPTRTAPTTPAATRSSEPTAEPTRTAPTASPSSSTAPVADAWMVPVASVGWIKVQCIGTRISYLSSGLTAAGYVGPEINVSDYQIEFQFHGTADGAPDVSGVLYCDASGAAHATYPRDN